jgi:signal transduction histidine kinase
MNLFGNAQKYTDKGYIIVRLNVQDLPSDEKPRHGSREYLSLQIRDSGKGMSSEYMERKLYHPFAQEDSFAPGVGLGLSIV